VGIITGMAPPPVDNTAEPHYRRKLEAIAERLRSWPGPIVVIAHVDPDGDALGSTLAMTRALAQLGKTASLPLEPPRFLSFLAEPGELCGPLPALDDGTLLLVLDVSDAGRAVGAPLAQAAFTVNIDHHGTNDRFGDLALVDPSKAATAVIVKDLIEALGVTWTPEIATPCLTGILTDTGTFRFGNTDPMVLRAAADLIEVEGVAYAPLADRLQWRHPDYFVMLGRVMRTVEFPFGGLAVMAQLRPEMRADLPASEDDSSDYVGLIRYAEGSKVALFLREVDDGTKVSARARDDVSAQAICLELGGGGHVAAAGAKLALGFDEARVRVLAAVRNELQRKGCLS
jgi:phosphoesterase RecJ-like protein